MDGGVEVVRVTVGGGEGSPRGGSDGGLESSWVLTDAETTCVTSGCSSESGSRGISCTGPGVLPTSWAVTDAGSSWRAIGGATTWVKGRGVGWIWVGGDGDRSSLAAGCVGTSESAAASG